MKFIHLSDLHYRGNWPEEQGVVLRELFDDMSRNVEIDEQTFAVFSGDIFQSSPGVELQEEFETEFCKQLSALGLSKDKRIFVPGNHEVDRNFVEKNIDTLQGLRSVSLSESQFNEWVRDRYTDFIRPRFASYIDFQSRFSKYGCDADFITGMGHALNEDIGIYCLNSAISSLAGAKDLEGNDTSDQYHLYVETRKIYEWVSKTDFQFRILILHHPLHWLSPNAQKQLKVLLRKHFDLVFCGHVHKPDLERLHFNDNQCSVVIAPPLFQSKLDPLGYSFIEVDHDFATSITYRQWTPDQVFVLGTAVAGNDLGKIQLAPGRRSTMDNNADNSPRESQKANELIEKNLRERFEDALKCYTALEPIWLDMDIATSPEIVNDEDDTAIVHSSDLVKRTDHYIVKSLPQFGLTCLGKYIALESWTNPDRKFVLVINSSDMPNHEKGILTFCKSECLKHHLDISRLERVVVDGWSGDNPQCIRQINSILLALPNVAVTILATIDVPSSIGATIFDKFNEEFSEFYLWSLKRNQIRQLVQEYIALGSRLDENQAVSKIAEHLDALNLHRTALNCILLLKVFEHHIDISPVNRTELMEKFLFFLFSNVQQTPRYSTLPDMKDSLYALGYFCEQLLRRNNILFTKDEFTKSVKDYCSSQLMFIDIDVLFDGLLGANLLTASGARYSFRYIHWIYFFAAQRMHHSKEFYDFVVKDRAYARFPEMIEFFSGIDRRRNELVEFLIEDLGKLNREFEDRTKMPQDFDPYKQMAWKPTEDSVKGIRDYIGNKADQMALPNVVKDLIADHQYDSARPYTQEIRQFVDKSSLLLCTGVLRVAALALRNSDHADVDSKKRLLQEIMCTWSRVLQVAVLLSPLLAERKVGGFEGFGVYLASSFDDIEDDQLWAAVMTELPRNVVAWYERDVFSHKMSPMYDHFLSGDADEIGKFLMCAMLVHERPIGWGEQISKYIGTLDKNSFYIYAILKELIGTYRIDFCTTADRDQLRSFVGTIVARHKTKTKKPNKNLIEDAARHLLDDDEMNK